jgi:hypothetical protein
MNPRKSIGRWPLPPPSTGVPWWEAVDWTDRIRYSRVRQHDLVGSLMRSLITVTVFMLAFAIAGLAFGWGQ